MKLSLLSKSDSQPGERDEMQTANEFKEELLEKERARQKKNRAIHLGPYKEQKKRIDQLDEAGLSKYILETEKSSHDSRVGNLNMKINPHEFARAKLAVMKSGAGSARELFFKLIEESELNKGK